MLREIYGSGSAEAAAGFAQILDEERPDLIHIHAFTQSRVGVARSGGQAARAPSLLHVSYANCVLPARNFDGFR